MLESGVGGGIGGVYIIDVRGWLLDLTGYRQDRIPVLRLRRSSASIM